MEKDLRTAGLMEELLSIWGYRVIKTNDIEHAAVTVRNKLPDIIILEAETTVVTDCPLRSRRRSAGDRTPLGESGQVFRSALASLPTDVVNDKGRGC